MAYLCVICCFEFLLVLHIMIHYTLYLSRQLIPTRCLEDYSSPVLLTLPLADIPIENQRLLKLILNNMPCPLRFHHAILVALSLCFSPHPLDGQTMDYITETDAPPCRAVDRQVVPVHVVILRYRESVQASL